MATRPTELPLQRSDVGCAAIPPRLDAGLAVLLAEEVDGATVDLSDPRLVHFADELMAAGDRTECRPTFLRWPDGSMGFALVPLCMFGRMGSLMRAYDAARKAHELRYLSQLPLPAPGQAH